jgi:uncharacterized protein YhdP
VRKTHPLTVKGKVDFKDNQLNVVEGVSATQLSGSLHFTEKSFTADQLEAQLFGKPATIVVSSHSGDSPKVVVDANGRAELAELRNAFKLQLLDYLEGESAWQASLVIPRGVSAKGSMLEIHSDLLGVRSNLPLPLRTNGESRRDLNLRFYLSGVRSGETALTLDDELGIVWRREEEGASLRRVQLRLGESGPLSLPANDRIEVLGPGGKLALRPWYEVLRKLGDEKDAEGDSEGVGKPLSPVKVELQRLQLLHEADSGTDERVGESDGEEAAQALPPLELAVGEFHYNDMPLGKVALRAVPQEERYAIKEVRLESDAYTLNASGEWKRGGNTFFDYEMKSADLGELMRRLGFASIIKGGKTTSEGKVWWAGDPAQVSLPSLNGQIAVTIKEGTMVDVEPGAGRMLGILSIPALPRRLFLDFSDVVKEGFVFERIEGDIRIEQGHAYTTNLQLESVPANILITGRTGLDTQDFDQELFVVPNVSDTATVASALAWGPQVAAVVALFQEAFKENISAATMSRYRITGSWEEPHIRRLVEQQEEEEDLLFLE